MMLTDAEDVEADLVGELDFLHEITEPLRRADDLTAVRIRSGLRERIDTDLHAKWAGELSND
jgi:hypothetical protein